MNILFAATIYFFIGLVIIQFTEPKNSINNIKIYCFTYFVAIFVCGFYYLTWILLGLENHKGVEGLFSPDSSTYYLDAVDIVNASFSSEVLNRVITDHYHELFLAIQIFVFGEHVLIPKIYQVLLFSIAVVLWVSIARDILRQKKMVKYFCFLLVFCVPLLTYSAHALKEISLFLATTVAFYGFTKYHFKIGHQYKYLWIALLGITFMFLLRREFALVMFLSLITATFLGSGLSLKKKIGWGTVSAIGLILIAVLPVFQQIGALAPLTEGGMVHVGRTDTGARVAADVDTPIGGMLGSALIIVTNPLLIIPMFIYGVIQLFFHPPFLFTPNEMIERGGLSYLTMGYYNILFTFMLPALYFGAKDLFKRFKGNPVFIALLIYFLFASLATIFGSDSYRRFKISYFWPIAYLCISYGFVTFRVWKKKIPLVALILIGLLLTYFTVDFIGLVS